MLLRIIIFIIFSITNLNAKNLKNCEWNNSGGIPCVVISKTPNTSSYNGQTINKVVFTKQQINESGSTTALDLIKKFQVWIFTKLDKKDSKLLFL